MEVPDILEQTSYGQIYLNIETAQHKQQQQNIETHIIALLSVGASIYTTAIMNDAECIVESLGARCASRMDLQKSRFRAGP